MHVWRIRQADWRCRETRLRSFLSDVEKTRADRFHHDADRLRYIVAHGVMRLVLSRRYLRAAPDALVFEAGSKGKPRLIRPRPEPALCFNLAHSADLILLAVAATEVGVDVEQIRARRRWAALAEYAFSNWEQSQLAGMAPDRRPAVFHHGWVRKEAYLKARGDGLSFPPADFSVSLAPDDVRLLEVPADPPETGRWAMAGVDVGQDYCAAVALEALTCRCQLHDARPRDFVDETLS